MASPYPATKYIISRYSDPVFAIFIGFSAALLRIRKEEIEKRSGLPSASMVTSPAQRKATEMERESSKTDINMLAEMYKPGDGGSSEGNSVQRQQDPRSGGSALLRPKMENVGYLEILKMGWGRLTWKIDYEWNGRAKEVMRKDGRLV